jgi:hypothetical protein
LPGRAAGGGAPARKAAKGGASASPGSRARVYGVAAAAVVVGLALWLTPRSRVTGDAAKQTAFRPDTADSTPVQHAGNLTGDRDSLMMSATSSDGGSAIPVEPRDAKTTRANAKETIDPRGTQPAVVKHTANAPDTTHLASNLRSTRGTPAQSQGGGRPEPPAREVAPAPGFLSVYYLGAVGELWVDGKHFSRQPPFDKVSIASGTHRLACRMSSDQVMQELTVTIRPGHETVVEYEVGGKPIATDE